MLKCSTQLIYLPSSSFATHTRLLSQSCVSWVLCTFPCCLILPNFDLSGAKTKFRKKDNNKKLLVLNSGLFGWSHLEVGWGGVGWGGVGWGGVGWGGVELQPSGCGHTTTNGVVGKGAPCCDCPILRITPVHFQWMQTHPTGRDILDGPPHLPDRSKSHSVAAWHTPGWDGWDSPGVFPTDAGSLSGDFVAKKNEVATAHSVSVFVLPAIQCYCWTESCRPVCCLVDFKKIHTEEEEGEEENKTLSYTMG